MDFGEGSQYRSEDLPLSFPLHHAFCAGVDGAAPMFEAMDWMPWEDGDGGVRIPHQDWIEVQPTFSTNVDLVTLFNDSSTTLCDSAFPANLQESDRAARVRPYQTSLSTQYPLFVDQQVVEVLQDHTQMRHRLVATSNSPEQILSLREPNRHPSPKDWAFYRPIFTRLYRDENRTLKDVKSIMKHVYNFNATDKMYNKRIKDWQLFKHQKATEKDEILQHLEVHRKLGVDLGQPMIRGQEVKEYKIARHVRGKRKADCLASEPTPRDREMRARGPSTRLKDGRCEKRAGLQCTTSRHAISFSLISDPVEYRNTENLLIHIDHYFCSKLENNPRTAWDLWLKSSALSGGAVRIQYTYQNRTYIYNFRDPRDISSRYAAAIHCFGAGRARSGWKFVHEAAETIRPCLSQEDPHFLIDLMDLLTEQEVCNSAEIKNLLLDLIADMASIVYGERHSISKICQTLKAFRNREHVVYLAQRKLLDTLNLHLGNDHSASFNAWIRVVMALEAQKTNDEAKRNCRKVISSYEVARGRNDLFTRFSLFQLALLCYRAGEFLEAADILADVLERGKDHGEIDTVNIKSHEMLGFIYNCFGNYGMAELHLWIGLSCNVLRYGPQDPITAQIYIFYRELVEKQQESQVAFRGPVESPSAPGNTFDQPSWCVSRRRANSLPGDYSLDCPCSEPLIGHGQALRITRHRFDEPLQYLPRQRSEQSAERVIYQRSKSERRLRRKTRQ